MGEGRNEGAEDEAAGTIPSQDHAARQQTHTRPAGVNQMRIASTARGGWISLVKRFSLSSAMHDGACEEGRGRRGRRKRRRKWRKKS
jgi:hypothetical protein